MSTVPWLDDNNEFPPPASALEDPDGLLAVGGDLSPNRLLAAYRQGIFPWYQDNQPILWWSPDPRTILIPGKMHCSRSLRKQLRHEHWDICADRDFEAVVRGCARPAPGRSSTWITPEMQSAYCQLHRLGDAHSIEAYRDGKLAGGLYGVSIGRVFFGESMFSAVSGGSKITLLALSLQLQLWGFELIDCQMSTSHLSSLGSEEISREQFVSRLKTNCQTNAPHDWQDWSIANSTAILDRLSR